jgi:hypothetical protein
MSVGADGISVGADGLDSLGFSLHGVSFLLELRNPNVRLLTLGVRLFWFGNLRYLKI